MEDSKKTMKKSVKKIVKSLMFLFTTSIVCVILAKVIHTFAHFFWSLW